MSFKANNMYNTYCVRVNVFALSIYTCEKCTWIYDSTLVIWELNLRHRTIYCELVYTPQITII